MNKKIFSIILVMLMLVQCMAMLPFTASAAIGDTYALVTDASQLEAGAQYLIVCQSKGMVMGAQNGTNRKGVEVTIADSKITEVPADAQVVTLGGSEGAWTLGVSDTEYLYWDSANTVKTGETAHEWTIDIAADGTASVASKNTPARKLQWNASSPRFACYTSAQTAIQLFKFDSDAAVCQHTSKTATAAQDATCVTPGNIAYSVCDACGAYFNANGERIAAGDIEVPAPGHNYVEGFCSACSEEQPKQLTVDRGSFASGSGYDWHNWTATTTTGETISGSGYIYASASTSVQMSGDDKPGDYVYNITPLPGKIVSIKLTLLAGKTERNVGVLTSSTPFDSASTPLLKEQAADAKQKITEAGVTWEFNTNDKYFAIVIVDAAAVYISSIEITYEICPHSNQVAIGDAKNATCTEDGITAGVKCADCGEIIEAQETIDALGHSFVSGSCSVCGKAQCASHVWVDGAVITPATCTATGLQSQHCDVCGQPNPTDKVLPIIPHTAEIDAAIASTCIKTGLTEGSHCSVCGETLVAQTVAPVSAHTYVDGVCSLCGDMSVTGYPIVDFQFGENGAPGHKDGSAVEETTKFMSNGFALNLTGATRVYSNAFDAMGNAALKLGTSSIAASFTFTVADYVDSVVISVAGYKAAESKISVNGTEYTIISKSDDGIYTNIVVDTTANKTVTLTTLEGGYRAMINAIRFMSQEAIEGVLVDRINGYTVTLGDNIGVNFYMELTDATLADETAYMLFTLPDGTTTKIYVKDIKGDFVANGTGTYYKFTGLIAVKEMSKNIKAQLFTASSTSDEYTYTVKAYAMYIINNAASYTANEVSLAKALLNYGACAQLMFNYETDDLANSELAEGDQTLPEVTISENYVKNVTANITGVVYLGTSTMWEADMAIRHYFNITGENITCKLYDAENNFIKDLEVLTGDNGKYIAIDGIVAKDMATTYKLVVSNGAEEQTITYSVYSYFYDILASDAYSEVEKAAIKAAYIYAEAAIKYLAEK